MSYPDDPLFDISAAAGHEETSRRTVLLASLLASLPLGMGSARASAINPSETTVTLPDAIQFVPWSGGPPESGDMARLYGDLNQPGPYLVFMRWHPGYFSAPHSYRTDRISVVVSGTWWVNSGADFDPAHAVPVPAGGFVLRHAHTPHYDGVPHNEKEPAVIALFGTGPVDFRLVDPNKPPWRRV
ncbi:MAG TPA: cupin domain-containing protein [Rhizomicrobium sp.]|nr:cupin domain-containing protein [Rhizomicrobium sp.]